MPSSASLRALHSFPTRRSSDLRTVCFVSPRASTLATSGFAASRSIAAFGSDDVTSTSRSPTVSLRRRQLPATVACVMLFNCCKSRSEEYTSELQSRRELVCRLLRPSALYTLSLHDALPIYVLFALCRRVRALWRRADSRPAGPLRHSDPTTSPARPDRRPSPCVADNFRQRSLA